MACKFILGVPKQPSNAIYAELGRYPSETHRKISMIKYIKRFENFPEERLARKALKQLMVDDAKGHYNWFSQTTNLLKENNIEIDKDSHFTIRKKVKANYETGLINALKNCITEQKKLRTYAEFKTVIKFGNYPNIIKNQKIRFNLTRFRLGVNDLEIEKGRYKRHPVPKELRLCKLCRNIQIQAIEDEKHFLLHCPMYNTLRYDLYRNIATKQSNLLDLKDNEKFVWLLSQEDTDCSQWLSKFINKAFEKRKSTLEESL